MKHFKFLCVAFLASVLLASCEKNKPISGIDINTDTTLSGAVMWDDGTPAAGVTVTDGYTCTQTDASGKYSLDRNLSAYYVYYSIPSDAKVNMGSNGLPVFYQRITNGKSVYDFTLTRQSVEKKVRILGLGDPQVSKAAQVKRFNTETAVDITRFVKEHDSAYSTYAITLGDIVSNTWDLFPDMVQALAASNMSVTVFNTIGNHDHEFPQSAATQEKRDLAAQRRYETYFGPVNYSFNRGDLHIVSLDDIMHEATGSSDYVVGLYDWQIEWLRQDLSYVPKDKCVIVCYHGPLKTADVGMKNRDALVKLLSEYKTALMMAGHTHNVRYYLNTDVNPVIHEYVVGTTCGAWWHGTTCTDGAPNGYGVFEFDGPELVNQFYKSTHFPDDYQMRLYHAQEVFYQSGTTGYDFKKKGSYDVVANIWNIDPDWKVEVYEDGVYSGKPKLLTDRDAWTTAHFYNAEKVTATSYGNSYAHHHFYTLKNKNAAEVKFVATDKWGHVYEQNIFTTDKDRSDKYYNNY